jgi:hypothetical protein
MPDSTAGQFGPDVSAVAAVLNQAHQNVHTLVSPLMRSTRPLTIDINFVMPQAVPSPAAESPETFKIIDVTSVKP